MLLQEFSILLVSIIPLFVFYNTMKSTFLLSYIYAVLAVVSLVGAFTLNTTLHLGARIFLIPTLLGIYLSAVSKKDWNTLYILMIFLFGVGELFYVYVEDYFQFSLYFYLISHVLFIRIIYAKFLVNKSFFDIFSFSLPFLLPYSIILILYENLNLQWHIIVTLFGLIACVNGSVVLINYAKTRNIQNYLLFIGFFILSLVDTLAGVYMFNIRDELYYLLSLSLDLIAKYMICRGFSLKREDGLIIV